MAAEPVSTVMMVSVPIATATDTKTVLNVTGKVRSKMTMHQRKTKKVNECLDFRDKPLKKGDWVIRAVSYGSTSAWLVYSRLEEDPQPNPKKGGWAFWIRTYRHGIFGGRGKAENHTTMIRIEESEVPKEILEAASKL
jgi:hypothetical protein